jgi:hypothetical protein
MSKPRKTPHQLERLIKKAVAKALPEDLVISVWPDANTWMVVCHSPHPLQEREYYELVRAEADRLKLKFDVEL